MITGDVYSSKIIDSQAPDGITIHNKAGYSSLSQPPPLAASFREVNLEASSSWESRFESLVPVILEGDIDGISNSFLTRFGGSLDCLTRLPNAVFLTVARIAHSASQQRFLLARPTGRIVPSRVSALSSPTHDTSDPSAPFSHNNRYKTQK